MTCEQVTLNRQPSVLRRRLARIRSVFGLCLLLASAADLGCGGPERIGDYAGTHSLQYELAATMAGDPSEVIPIEYMGIISVYRQGDEMEIDLNKTCALKGTQTARNGITLEGSADAKCMMKLRNIPARCRASGNIPDVRLAFKSPMRIYLTKNQEITLEGDFEFHSTEAVPCREAFVKASYSFKGTASEL
jgi:hypothetical protein